MKGGTPTNIVFWLLIIVAMIAAWVLLSFLFKWIGGIFVNTLSDVKDAITDEDQEEDF